VINGCSYLRHTKWRLRCLRLRYVFEQLGHWNLPSLFLRGSTALLVLTLTWARGCDKRLHLVGLSRRVEHHLKWVFRTSLRLKVSWQIQHTYGRSPVSIDKLVLITVAVNKLSYSRIREWRLRCLRLRYVFGQLGHWNLPSSILTGSTALLGPVAGWTIAFDVCFFGQSMLEVNSGVLVTPEDSGDTRASGGDGSNLRNRS
jgi:hypothetical protein